MKLTPEQDIIASHTEGPALVLAGAGSGKTATLVERAGRVINEGVDPRNIMLLTFSRKAATEIKSRIKERFGNEIGSEMRIDTFHGFGYEFMRVNKEMFGLGEDQKWGLLDESGQKRFINDLCDDASQVNNLDKKQLRNQIKKHFRSWSLLKQEGRLPGDLDKALSWIDRISCRGTTNTPGSWNPSTLDRVAVQSLIEYEKQKSAQAYLDFDDLIYHPARMLHRHPAMAEGYSRKHQHLMIDESQDLNQVQYLTAKAIGIHHGNVMLVGDDDQGIYGFRGAKVAIVKRFAQEFGANLLRLERNFRSHNGIVEAANRLIQHNQARMPKTPYAEGQGGKDPVVQVTHTDRDMAQQIAQQINDHHHQGGNYSDFAVIYRTNRMAQILEPTLKQTGIPYTVVGGMSFFERREIQAVINNVRLIEKADDWQALKAVQPYLDGVGIKGMTDFISRMKEQNKDLFELATMEPEQAKELGGKAAGAIRDHYHQVIDCVLRQSQDKSSAEIARTLVEWVKDGPMRLLEREKDDQMRKTRHENLEQLVEDVEASQCEDFVEWMMETPISDYKAEQEDGDVVTLSTVHRMKGLEYPNVIIAGFSDGLMPYDQGILKGESATTEAKPAQTPEELEDDDGGRPEEERRLAYVALTRAGGAGTEGELTCYAPKRFAPPGGEPVNLQVSRYAEEAGLEVQHPENPLNPFSGLDPDEDFSDSPRSASMSMG